MPKLRKRESFEIGRIMVLVIFLCVICGIVIFRLFFLQVINHGVYKAKADKQHQGTTSLPARRGDILIKDYHSSEVFKVATNTTVYRLIVDPTLTPDPLLVADELVPVIFDIEEEVQKDQEFVNEQRKYLRVTGAPDEEVLAIQTKTEEELYAVFKENLIEKISDTIRDEILLTQDIDQEGANIINSYSLQGVEAYDGGLKVFPKIIDDKTKVARALSPYLDMNEQVLEQRLEGKNRYVVIKKTVDVDEKQQIEEIMEKYKDRGEDSPFFGVKLEEEYKRYYPEGDLASQVLGFVDEQGGKYGIEGHFNAQLKGEDGLFQTQRDAMGKQITVGESVIRPAQDGDSYLLTIDRSIQMEVEKLLAKTVKGTNADTGQVLVMDPKSGRVLAMANYPAFDPNEFGEALQKEIIELTYDEKQNILTKVKDDYETHYLVINEDVNDMLLLFEEEVEDNKTIYYKYKNNVGPEVYKNRTVTDIYEPGSVFKTIAMAIALDDGDVTPYTQHYCGGLIEVDEYEIHTSDDEYHGWETMTEVLENSCNIGMAFVANKLGRELFYSYILKFGFNERTDIEFDNEHTGRVQPGANWADSELVTAAFGQGISATPIQMVTALSALANKGILMQPYIVDTVIHANGEETVTEDKPISRVISENTGITITAMLVSAVENGVANKAMVDGYHVAGKTGTSQTYKNGKPLKGAGTTITSFAGYGPIDEPKFVVLIKLDRPRSSEWGSDTAAPLFSEIAEYLFKYYNIPPDR